MGVFDQFRIDGKTALVTGASRGLGRAMALALAEAGADLVITGRDEASLATTADEIRALGRKASTKAIDMGVPEACRDGFHECLRDFGPIDILINNIGGRRVAEPIEEQTLESWHHVLDLNLTSCFLGTSIIGAAMLKRGQGGRIVNVSSMNAFVSNRGIGGRSYEAAKAAVVQFTRAAAADWAPHGITVNAICPGLFMTDANRAWNEKKPEVIDKLVAGIPMGRAGEPHEIGPLAVFLASPASSFVTGATHLIDGGYTLL
ncbi:SDR family NAD(P)-dependent oxidoreductase [Bauldia litoralis]|uniref:Gluconate 5-dehydrogenase n=1 Tax=Bauldia litoralis TaxID=665467 RepID=A0A1G6BTK7_9HYPH|nr:SDR family NAD(P)-dependent oxidoreductase [Bauldia litoralis]SDB23963.1 gluconate 5-dehydrogenase [Bauldia litoralis]